MPLGGYAIPMWNRAPIPLWLVQPLGPPQSVCAATGVVGIAWAVRVWWCCTSSWGMGHGVASAWGQHSQHVVGVPVSGSCCNSGGWNLRAVGGGSIHQFLDILQDRSVTSRPLAASRRTASMVASKKYRTCSGDT